MVLVLPLKTVVISVSFHNCVKRPAMIIALVVPLNQFTTTTGWPICIETVVVRAIDAFFLTFSSKSLFTNPLALFWCILSHFSPILSDRWLKIMFCENRFQALVLLFSSYLVYICYPKSYNPLA